MKRQKTGKRFTIRRGAVTTYVYQFTRKHPTADNPDNVREIFTAAWTVGGQRQTRQFSTYAAAHGEASLRADQLAAGRVDAATNVTAEDGNTLTAAKAITGGVPLLAALQEWAKARKLTDGNILPAAEQWKARHAPGHKRIELGDAIEQFIAAKDKSGHQGERTYRSKLKALTEHFTPDTYLDEITTAQLGIYLSKFGDGVSRNDYRKRAVTLWNWARDNGHLPEGLPVAPDRTLRAKEKATQIGIINADTYSKLLEFVRAKHPQHLAAVVLAGFCGIRSDEIHGKRADRSIRQSWEDIHLDRNFLSVTCAKENTPAWRHVPLCESAVAWLMLCKKRKGVVCESGAMEKVRKLALEAGHKLPANCLRHSFISYRIAQTGNKPQVALEAGNSVTEIDRRYRVPVTAEQAADWFGIRPATKGKVIQMKEAVS